ncbi:hypothetical protein, partial [Tsukamurella sp. 8J]|uniref:hypothetical protein n=1 Tax=Tsukamurella sp. 8J TaxID=3031962 RepID=UPI0023B9AE31
MAEHAHRYLPAVFVLLLSSLTLLTVPGPHVAATVGVAVAVALVAASLVETDRLVLARRATTPSGPPPSAGRRRRGAFLRQSQPDTPGR